MMIISQTIPSLIIILPSGAWSVGKIIHRAVGKYGNILRISNDNRARLDFSQAKCAL